MEIIAEIGQNHNGDMKIAAEMIRRVKENGADAAKFQVYDAKKLFPKIGNPWYEYNCKTELSRDNVCFLADECRKSGIEFLASVFDAERITWLEEAGVKRYKVASRSINDKGLLNCLAETGKPLLVSLGMWSGKKFPDIRCSHKIDFLYCISKYPTPLSDVKLSRVDFKLYSGFSDHTIGISTALTALARGARIIEKHFTLDTSMYGPDHESSMVPNELKTIDSFRRDLQEILG